MITAIAVDDEINALGIIKEFSHRIPDLDLIQAFTDPMKALQFATTRKRLDLIFLDIQMSQLNGLTLARDLPKSCRIILSTAYPDYALQGYEMDVVDYLLKPFSFERFERSVQKVRYLQDIISNNLHEEQQKIKPAADDIIFVRTDYKSIKVNISDITYIEGSGNYVTLHTVKGKILLLQNLKKLEEQLQPYQFVRVHKSFIVSLSHIESIENKWILINSKEIPLSESYRESFQQFLNRNSRQI